MPKWVIGEVMGTCWIRDNEIPFWGFMVRNAQLKVVVISGLSFNWYRKARRWRPELRDKIGKEE